MKRKPIVALIYDFDGTLSPGNMQEFGFIQAVGKTPKEFWTMSDGLAAGQDASNVLSYMKMMFDEARKNGITLRRSDFRKFGKHIELFEGVKDWFRLVNEYGAAHGVRVEHYINSSGLKEIIEGSPFKISKGIFSAHDNKKVNESVAEDKKRIPYPQMIYFGDGETDIPSMKIVTMFGGHSIAVYEPGNTRKKAFADKLKRQGRVSFTAPADYRPDSRTFKVVCAIIDKIKADYELKQLA